MATEPQQQPGTLKPGLVPHSPEADADLVRAASSGNLHSRHRAFSVLVVRYERLIRSLLRSLGARTAEAEEITQEAYISAWRNLSSLRQPERFLPWLKQIAYRQFLRSIGPDERALPDEYAEASTQDQPWIDRELRSVLACCTRDEQELLILCYAFEFTIGEIAASRGVPSGTIKSQLHRARQKIKTSLGENQLGDQHNG